MDFGYWYYDWFDSIIKVKSINTVNDTIESDSNADYGIRDKQRYYFLIYYKSLILQENITLIDKKEFYTFILRLQWKIQRYS